MLCINVRYQQTLLFSIFCVGDIIYMNCLKGKNVVLCDSEDPWYFKKNDKKRKDRKIKDNNDLYHFNLIPIVLILLIFIIVIIRYSSNKQKNN
jgi:hypothetical protein